MVRVTLKLAIDFWGKSAVAGMTVAHAEEAHGREHNQERPRHLKSRRGQRCGRNVGFLCFAQGDNLLAVSRRHYAVKPWRAEVPKS